MDRIKEIAARCAHSQAFYHTLDTGHKQAIDDEAWLLAEVERLRQARRWIPTGERLPEPNDGFVLAIVSGKPHENITLHRAHQLAEYTAADGWIISEYLDWEDAEVSCWMPLPAAPEEGEAK